LSVGMPQCGEGSGCTHRFEKGPAFHELVIA
jgi:hypothetical protein